MTYSQERIIPIDLRNEMSRSYLEYAMSVIVGRALPDARDEACSIVAVLDVALPEPGA